jgi:hypothetical protein
MPITPTTEINLLSMNDLVDTYAHIGALLRSRVLNPRERQIILAVKDRVDLAIVERRRQGDQP